MQNPEPIGKITTELTLSGQSFDADLFSKVANQQPTKIWHQKLELLKNNPKFPDIPQIAWRYELHKRPHWSVDDAIREMLDLFEPRQKQIVSFAEQYNCSLHLSCRIYGDSTVIIYKIEPAMLKQLAAFKCEFSFTVE